jgi:hypothetical protein
VVIPEAAPSAGGFRRLVVLDATFRVFDTGFRVLDEFTRRAVVRAGRAVRRVVRAADFFVLRLAEDDFFER